MKNRPIILRISAFLLILVFSQKSGAGLALHDLLHVKSIIAEQPVKEDQNNRPAGYVCTCIDDFFMPFEEIVVPVCSQPVLHAGTILLFNNERVSLYYSHFISLRGPPSV